MLRYRQLVLRGGRRKSLQVEIGEDTCTKVLIDLQISANSSGGRNLRLEGRGISAKVPGDLNVILQIALPKTDSNVAKKAYPKFEKATEFSPCARPGA